MSGPRTNGADLDALADRTLELVAGRAEAAVTVRDLREGLTRFANSFIHQNVGDRRVTLTLDVACDGRTASSTTTDTSDEALRRLVESALAAATAVQPVDEEWPGLAPPAAAVAAPGAHYDPATAEVGPAGRADVVASFVAAGAGLEAAGYCATEVADELFVNSAGQRIADSVTSAEVDGIHRLGRSDGCAAARSVRLADVDGAALGAVAAGVARSGTDAIELPAGRYEVVLERRAVAYMLDFFTVYGFNARAVQEGRSFAFLGEEQFDRALSIWDDATDRRQVGLGFDAEGTPKRRVDLVHAGRVVGLTHDRRTAAKGGPSGSAANGGPSGSAAKGGPSGSAAKGGPGVLSTGHAVAGGASVGAVATNLFVAGAAPNEAPVAELIGRVGRGLLVKDFWYTRVLDPRTLVVTGLTRNGVFLISDGQVGPAVTNLRFTQSPVAAFGPGRVLGVGDDAALAPGGLHLSWHHAPSLHLAEWNFTGNASG